MTSDCPRKGRCRLILIECHHVFRLVWISIGFATSFARLFLPTFSSYRSFILFWFFSLLLFLRPRGRGGRWQGVCLLSWVESLKTSRASKQQTAVTKTSHLTFFSSSNSPRSPKPHFPELTSPITKSDGVTFTAEKCSLLGSENLLTPLSRPPPARH